MNFSNKVLDFSLRFWINDPIEGSTNVKSAALLALWDAFKREGIEFPSPVTDLRLQGPVRVAGEN
jgi:small-conductance mechanosensitive channel